MAATYTARINAVDRAQTHVLLDGFKINEVTNGINTLVCRVASEDASYRPLKRQPIEIEEDDGSSPPRVIFGGTLRSVREHGWGMTADGDDAIILELSADSYKTLASRRFVTETIPAGSLKDALLVLEPYLNVFPYFVTLDPAQATGPTLEAIEFKVVRVDECLNFLATLSAKYGDPFTWTIGYDKVLGMYQTGTVAAPWNLLESEFTTLESSTDDIEVEPTDENYANKIIIVWGNGNVATYTDTFVGTGAAVTFGPLTYQLVGPVPPPPVTSPPTQSAVGFAFVDETPPGPPAGRGALGVTGTANMDWWFEPSTGLITKITGSPPALGALITIMYNGLVTGSVVAQNAGEIAAVGLWEDKILAPEIEDPVLALSVAEAELARRIATGRIVRFKTRRLPGPQPGESITITVPKRAISGAFTVTDVATENEPGNVNALIRTVTCNSSIHEQEHQTLTRWWSEKDTAGITTPAGSSAVPDWPLNSVQFNDNWSFGGASHVLYGDLFWDTPDLFTSPPEVRTKGLSFVTNGAIGDPGHIGLLDPNRLEMGMLGSGDFSMDLFSDVTFASPMQFPRSILMNSTGDIFLTAGTGQGSPADYFGGVRITGDGAASGIGGDPVGFSVSPGVVGDSYSIFRGLNVLQGVAGVYQTITSLPYTINTTSFSDDTELLTFFVNATSGTVTLPPLTDFRASPAPFAGFAGRMFYLKNIHGSGVVTIEGDGTDTIDGSLTLTLSPGGAVLLQRHETGWTILASTGGVVSGGGVGASVLSAAVVLADAQVKALPTTPITLVTAPGAGFRIRVLAHSYRFETSAGAYTNIDASYADLHLLLGTDYVGYGPVKDTSATPTQDQITGTLATVADRLYDPATPSVTAGFGTVATFAYAQNLAIGLVAQQENAALQVAMDNNGTGNLTGGNAANFVRLTVYYVLEAV